jgi:hypothetical protein
MRDVEQIELWDRNRNPDRTVKVPTVSPQKARRQGWGTRFLLVTKSFYGIQFRGAHSWDQAAENADYE